ncbi:hypothetical protein V9K67_01635 [Paraflavisolibacter sp. H34]|uniref:DUF6941 family protein n=1 Tax=Huijunlia imazamoxiresistens TaxID=3127457 RepID=UPI00301674F1
MQVEIFTLCDYAQDYGGKLFINGTFDSIHSQGFPFVYPSFSIAGRFRFSEKEFGTHKLKLTGKTPDGAELIQPIEGDITIQRPAPNVDYASTNFSINFAQLPFEKPGVYTFELLVDGESKSELKVIAFTQQQ